MAERHPPAAVRVADLAADRWLQRLWETMGRAPAWLAGGSVRDRLLGRPGGDLDIAVAGDAAAVARVAHRTAHQLGARAHLLGRPPRSVWRIVAARAEIELWPLGATSPEDDARRRDFTCNAMLWQLPHGPLVDPTGGAVDLAGGILRAVSPEVLADDPVRLLRAARFLADLAGFRLEERTEAWVRELSPTLAAAPRERVGQELAALLDAARPELGVAALLRLGLLAPAAPSGCTAEPAWLDARLTAFHSLTVPGLHPAPGAVAAAGATARRAILLRGLGAADQAAAARFAWDRAMRTAAVRAAGRLEELIDAARGGTNDRRERIMELGETFPAALAAAAACDLATGGRPQPWRRFWRLWRASGARIVHMRPMLTADEVVALAGPLGGCELGRLLRALLRAQVRGEVRSPGGARQWLRAAARARPPADGFLR